MAQIVRWWQRDPAERFWMEITDRIDPGINLKCPQRGEQGQLYYGYQLIHEVQPGDCIFHYDKRVPAITAASRASGEVWEDEIIWAAHSKAAARAGIKPHARPGWKLGLEGFTPLDVPVSLEAIRGREPEVAATRHALEQEYGPSLYFPLQVSEGRPLRPVQTYLVKFPAALVPLFGLAELVAELDASTSGVPASLAKPVGADYRPANEVTSISQRDPFSVDPAITERGVMGHAKTQNKLAALVRQGGLVPRSPYGSEPNFDIAWEKDSVIYVAEVKSITLRNEEKQLRLGLGQILRYAHIFRMAGRDVCPILAVEQEPSDTSWFGLCRALGVTLVCPHDASDLTALEMPGAVKV